MVSHPPYGILAREIREGAIVPFLGAGINSAFRPTHDSWTTGSPFLPSNSELSRHLARAVNFPLDDESLSTALLKPTPFSDQPLPQPRLDELATVASYYALQSSRRSLENRLRELYSPSYEPSPIHHYLAHTSNPLLIITTSYDDLLERAFARVGRPFNVVSTIVGHDEFVSSVLWWDYGMRDSQILPRDPQILPSDQLFIDLSRENVIYKILGSLGGEWGGQGNSVVTEEDYVEFLCQMWNGTAIPTSFMSHLRDRSLIYIGQGVADWVSRAILSFVSKEQNRWGRGKVSWAIQHNPSELEKVFWAAMGVDVFDEDLKGFAARLSEFNA